MPDEPNIFRTGYNRIDAITGPRGEPGSVAWVNESELRQIYKRSRWKFHNLLTAVEVLKRPRQVWLALRQVDGEAVLGYAYVGSPPSVRSTEGRGYPLPPGEVFLVFLDLQMTLVEWRRETALPGGFEVGERFKELLWSR